MPAYATHLIKEAATTGEEEYALCGYQPASRFTAKSIVEFFESKHSCTYCMNVITQQSQEPRTTNHGNPTHNNAL